MPVIDLILAIIVCICICIISTVFGYNVVELFTDGPKWKPWEQCLFWLFWAVIIPLFLIMLILFIVVGLLFPVLFVIGLIVRLIRKVFN